MAGGGSALTVPLLVAMTDGNIANGTNRVAVMFANLTAIAAYQKGEAVPWTGVRRLLIPTAAGSAAGAWTATQLSPEGMRRVFAVVLLLIALSVAFNANRWLESSTARLGFAARNLVFLFVGFYGGFVQIGVGILLLAALVLGSGFDMLRGNAAKVVLIAVYTPVALFFYFRAGDVDLPLGLILAAAYSSGAFTAARLAVQKGAAWARWVLIAAAAGAAVRMLFV